MSGSIEAQTEVLRQMATLLVDVALSVAPLIEATYQKPSPLGETEIHPTAKEIGALIRAKAAELRQAFPEGQSILTGASR